MARAAEEGASVTAASVPDAVILLAHGARDPRWAEPFLRVAALIRKQAPELDVEVAYLEHLAPSLEDAARRLAGRGARALRVVPLFVGRGDHLRVEVPRRVSAVAATLPGVAVDVALPAGDDAAVQQALAAFCIRAARSGA
jgi:sirohydrochlorin cobaltochelatase